MKNKQQEKSAKSYQISYDVSFGLVILNSLCPSNEKKKRKHYCYVVIRTLQVIFIVFQIDIILI